jgi:hypothetical protein
MAETIAVFGAGTLLGLVLGAVAVIVLLSWNERSALGKM